MDRAVELALRAEASGNAPVGAVLVLDGRVIAEGRNAVHAPVPDPRRHAEIEALAAVPAELWPRSREMTCYVSLEPCAMCTEAIAARGIGRVVYAARLFLPIRRRPPDGLEWIGPVGHAGSRALLRRIRRSALRRCIRSGGPGGIAGR